MVVVERLLVYKITFMDEEEISEPSEETVDEDLEEDEEDEGENEE